MNTIIIAICIVVGAILLGIFFSKNKPIKTDDKPTQPEPEPEPEPELKVKKKKKKKKKKQEEEEDDRDTGDIFRLFYNFLSFGMVIFVGYFVLTTMASISKVNGNNNSTSLASIAPDVLSALPTFFFIGFSGLIFIKILRLFISEEENY